MGASLPGVYAQRDVSWHCAVEEDAVSKWNALGSLRKTVCGRPGLECSQACGCWSLHLHWDMLGDLFRLPAVGTWLLWKVASPVEQEQGQLRRSQCLRGTRDAAEGLPGSKEQQEKRGGEKIRGEAESAWLSPASLGHCVPRGSQGRAEWSAGARSSIPALVQAGGCQGGWSGAPRRFGVPSPSTEARDGKAAAIGGRRL